MRIAQSLKDLLMYSGMWAFGGSLATILLGVIANMLLTRLLSPEEMGAYFLVLSLVSVAALVVKGGLSQAVIKITAESMGMGDSGRARKAVHFIFAWGTLTIIVISGGLYFGIGQWLANGVFKSSLMGNIIGLTAVWVAIDVYQGLQAATFRGFCDIRFATVFGGLFSSGFFVILLFVFWIVRGYSGLRDVVMLSMLTGVISIVLAWPLIRGKLRDLQYYGKLRSRDVFAIALPGLVTVLTYWLLTQSDMWILGMSRSAKEVALYGAAARIVILISITLSVINSVILPFIADLYAQGRKKELERILRGTATLSCIPACLVFIILTSMGDQVLGIIYGDFYRQGMTVLAILAVGQIFNVWAGPCGITLIMTGHQTALMVITICCSFMVIINSILLVRTYGAPGVALSSALGIIMQNILMLLLVKNKTGIWTHAQFVLPDVKEFLVRRGL